MAFTLDKPNWWNELANYYGFSNDSSSTIASDDLFDKLNDNVAADVSDMLSSTFLSSQPNIIRASTDSSQNGPNRLISDDSSDDMLIGYGSVDYLSGGNGDDILYGGSDRDYMHGGRGVDFIVGGREGSNDNDTASYLDATSGIVMIPREGSPEGDTGGDIGGYTSDDEGGLNPNQDIYTLDYDDWIDRVVPQINNFEVGPGGDFVDISDLLDSIGYTGSDPVADGFIYLKNLSSGMKIQFDADGFGGSGAKEAVKLSGISVNEFSVADNLLIEPYSGGGTPPPPPPSGGTGDFGAFQLVSDDGHGDYDVLFSIENIIGSDYSDQIYGQDNVENILLGGLGNDTLHGESGNDILVGGAGDDTLHGDEGDDLLILGSGNDSAYGDSGRDIFKITREVLGDLGNNAPTIKDFETGSNGDKLDVSEVLDLIGYSGSNPFGDGILDFSQNGSDLHLKIDIDGSGSDESPQTLAILENVDQGDFSTSSNLIHDDSTTLFVGVLGQSNAEGLRVFDGDSESGLTRLRDGLLDDTDFDQIIIPPNDEYGNVIRTAVGGTQVNGDEGGDTDNSWWFPDSNSPGEILLRAVDIIGTQIAEYREQGAVKPVLVWGQGESDAYSIGSQSSASAREEAKDAYKAATLAVFDYIKDRLGHDIVFYIMKTSRYNENGAQNKGVSQSTIDDTVLGVSLVREAQDEMASERSDVKIAADYIDLPMIADINPGSDDLWHYEGDEREIIGDLIAEGIAEDINNGDTLPSGGGDPDPDPDPDPGSDPDPVDTDSNLKLSGDTGDNTLVGGRGDDTLKGREGGDALYGYDGDDTLWGNDGDDTLVGGAGSDWIKGGSGADIYVFNSDSLLGGIDTIADFRPNKGDAIDFSDILSAFDPLSDAISDFIEITTNGSDSLLGVDTTGGSNFTQVAVLSGVTGLENEQDLYDSGNITV